MHRSSIAAASVLSMSVLGACAHQAHDPAADTMTHERAHTPPHPITPATPAQQAALLDRVKSLAGTWEGTNDQGQKETVSVFTVTSAGSAVREVMFPGSGHEMTNMYTMDGPSLVVTHYCAQGNQPHMRASASGTHDRIELKFDGVSNLQAPDQLYMGQLTIVFKDADHVREEWRPFKAGKPAEHDPAFDLTRRR